MSKFKHKIYDTMNGKTIDFGNQSPTPEATDLRIKEKVNKNSTDKQSDGKKTRTPKCQRCQNHMPPKKAPDVKNHKHKCKFKDCVCDDCNLLKQRQSLSAKQISAKRRRAVDSMDPNVKEDEMFKPVVIKKQEADECSSETDKNSVYNTGDNEGVKNVKKINEKDLFTKSHKVLEELKKRNSSPVVMERIHYVHYFLTQVKQKEDINEIVDQLDEEWINCPQIESNSPPVNLMSKHNSNHSSPTFTPLTPPTPTIPSPSYYQPPSIHMQGLTPHYIFNGKQPWDKFPLNGPSHWIPTFNSKLSKGFRISHLISD